MKGSGNGQTMEGAPLNRNVRGVPLSATLAINELSSRLIAEGKQIFRLGLGQSPFPVPMQVVEALRANAHQKNYLPVRGLPALREAVADYYNRRQQLSVRSENVLVGPGSKELMFILQFVYDGEILIPTPSWVSYAPQAHLIGRPVRWLPTRAEDGWLPTPEEIDNFCRKEPGRPRLLILNYPNNPTGCTYSAGQLATLAETARKHKLMLLSDEIYGELNFTGGHVSIARFYPEGTIISGGLSKWCGAGGWRLGTMTFPDVLDWLKEAMAAVASETYTSTSAPIQFAAVEAFRGGIRIERYLWHSRRILGALAENCRRQMSDAGLQVATPQGGFYLFADFSPRGKRLRAKGVHTSDELCLRLMEETGVAILPGSACGRPEEELTARLALVDFDGARALAAAEQLPQDEGIREDFLEAYCGRVMTAMTRLCEWMD
ncbi:pyridoxal phosphate-dependent aminotransferase [Desulfuromonas sp. TF]|uniref:pyridoxal phosphate-dependent aminotransferase n=1 Tax=Desulfuromonas sp. TF TaxID=1232410 RepID=UPI0003FD70D5|nr:pyridoxal phosphate-dependent aminotransferase [Desulfuromonas sp. TF]